MNSNFGKKFDFDLGLRSYRTTSLNNQKNKNSSFSSSPYSSAQAKLAWRPKKPSRTHQPPSATAPSQPTSIFGKSWSFSAPSSSIVIVENNPNLFGDLVDSALGQNKSTFFLSRSCRRRNGRRDGAIGGFAVLGGDGINGNKVTKPRGGGGRGGSGGGGHGDGVPDSDGDGGGDGRELGRL